MIKKIAVTGAIGSGKSTICRILNERYDVPIFYSDDEVKKLYKTSAPLKKKLVSAFGEQIFDGEEIVRKELAKIIFEDMDQLKKINEIVAPFVRTAFEIFCIKQEKEGHEFCIMESALVYEHQIESMFDYVIYVAAPEKIRMIRVGKRDEMTFGEFKERNEHFLDEDDKIQKADFVIDTFRHQISVDDQIDILMKRLPMIKEEADAFNAGMNQNYSYPNYCKNIVENKSFTFERAEELKRVYANFCCFERAANFRDIAKIIEEENEKQTTNEND